MVELGQSEVNGRDVARGEYIEVVPNTRVVFSWGWEGEGSPLPPGSSTVEVTLIPDGNGTIVRLRHLGLPSDQRDAHQEGWDRYMPRLAIAAAGGDPGAAPRNSYHSDRRERRAQATPARRKS